MGREGEGETGEGGDDLLHLLVVHEDPDVYRPVSWDGAEAYDAGQTRRVADDSEVLGPMVPERANEVLRGAAGSGEAVDHERRAVRYIGDGLIERGYDLVYGH